MLYWAEVIDLTFIYGYNQLLPFDSTALIFSVQNEWNFLMFLFVSTNHEQYVYEQFLLLQ